MADTPEPPLDSGAAPPAPASVPERPWWEPAEGAQAGVLYVVATPIGNLADLSRRAASILATADLLAAEDTRVTRKLTSHLGVPGAARLTSSHDHNERHRAPWLVEQLQAGRSVAVVSDAGTPLLSDPGLPVVQAAIDAGLPVVAIPGPSALLAALAVAGLPTDAFTFRGFLPTKTRPRQALLRQVAATAETQVFYEAPRRLLKSLDALAEAVGGERRVAALRDLTKQGEGAFRGSLDTVRVELSEAASDHVWGEWVLVLEGRAAEASRGAQESDASLEGEGDAGSSTMLQAGEPDPWLAAERLLTALMAAEVPTKRIRDIVAEVHDLPKREVYQRVLARSGGS